MARRFLRKYLPQRDSVHKNRLLSMFGHILLQPNLWHLNRRSVARAALVGLFWTVIPMPVQTIPGTACAIALRANLGLTLVLIWVTNPLTIAPVLWGCYEVGRIFIPSRHPTDLHWTWESISAHFTELWKPLYLGSLIVGTVMGVGGYLAVMILWRWHAGRRWRRRHGYRGLTASTSRSNPQA